MRYASLALRRDMLRVGCNYSGISSMSTIEWPGWLKWEGTHCCCGICVEWIVCYLSMFFKALTKCAFSFTYILFFASFTLDHICEVYPFQAKPPRIGHYRDYLPPQSNKCCLALPAGLPSGLFVLLARVTLYTWYVMTIPLGTEELFLTFNILQLIYFW